MFGAVSLIKHADIDQCKYSGYGIGFNRKGEFSYGTRGFGRNVVVFGADLSDSLHENNRANNILLLGKDFIQRVNGTTIYAEKVYSINFTDKNKKCCLSLQYNGADSYSFLGNTSKDFSVDNMKKTGINGYVYDFSIDYDNIAVDDILNIHKYLMDKNNIV